MTQYPRPLTVKHDAPKHRCPVCNHVCQVLPAKGGTIGRPATLEKKLLGILRRGSRNNPVHLQVFADELNVSDLTVRTYMWRLRKRGYNVRNMPLEGWWLEDHQGEEVTPLEGSATD